MHHINAPSGPVIGMAAAAKWKSLLESFGRDNVE
jgi:hypothetical protein